jgi:G:T-mismatch repair DNA endonuclease (very short patch repair protein)
LGRSLSRNSIAAHPVASRVDSSLRIERNVARERRNDQALGSEGWAVIRIREHETVAIAADRIAEVLGRWLRCGFGEPPIPAPSSACHG